MPGSKRLLPLLLALAWPLPGLAGPACQAPEELLRAEEPMPAVARAITAGELRLLVVGSASILGPGSSGRQAAWPARLQALLTARHPGLSVRLDLRGGQGTTATQQLALITEAVNQAPFDLLIWQTGTVEAARGLEVPEMVAALNTGLDLVAQHHADAMLMDPQFSRFLRANADLEPYRAALRLVATAHGISLFRRYDLMQSWVEADQVDVERADRSRRMAVTDLLHECLAEALAAVIADAAR
jgi:hypothetical protein